MTTYAADRRPQMGWGERIGLHFNSNVTIKNWAAGGRSSRSFYYESAMWPTAKAAILPGDYVIIQFGHNDQKYGPDDATTPSADTSTGPYSKYGTYAVCSDPAITDGEACTGGSDVVDTAAAKDEHSYYQFLKRYVAEVRAKGATPILMTPMVRREMASGAITIAGAHDYSATKKGAEANPRGNYPAAMKSVATKYDVPLIDITAETKALVEIFGSDAAAASLYVAGDSTHPQIMFAALIAKKASDGMKADSRLGALSSYMIAAPSTLADAYPVAFGPVTVGASSSKTTAIAAFDLSPAIGNLNVSAPANFQISTDNATWSQSLDVAYTGGAVTKVLYARFAPTAEQTYSGAFNVALAGSAVASVTVTGNGTAAITDYANWFAAGSGTSAIVTGRLNGSAANAVGLTAATAPDAVAWAVNGQSVAVQRYIVDTWIANDPAKYVEFTTTPTAALNITSFSMYFASYGGSNLRADMAYSLNADFSSPVTLNATTPLTSAKEILTQAKYSVASIPLAAGATIYVRVFPWQKTATGATKGIALYNVTVGGIGQ
ncbi:hypothetical protein GCM10027046_21180 [Uliginosibacterium flavum]